MATRWMVVALAVSLAACGGGSNTTTGGGQDAATSDAVAADRRGTDGQGEDSTAGDDAAGGTVADGTGPDDTDATGADGTDEPAPLPPLPTVALRWTGVWRSNFDSFETIGGLRWRVESKDAPTSTTRIVDWDDENGVIIVRFPDDDPYTPGQFARVELVTLAKGDIASCMVVYGKATAAEAMAAKGDANASDLDGKGCGGFPWTRLHRPEPVGLHESSFGGNERFDAEVMGWAATISWINPNRVAISQNAADDPYFPSAFNKIQWTEPDAKGFAYCVVDYGLATAELAAESSKTADAGDLDGKGCGGFAWTRLAPIEVAGVWSSAFGGTEHIDGMGWTNSRLISFDNAKNTAILRSPADDPYTANQYAKVVWSEPKDGSFHFCSVTFGQETAAKAEQAADTSDANDLDGKGCGGFAWTKLTKLTKPTTP